MARTESLTSPANPLIKDIRRAVSRGALTRGGYAIAETFHLLEEAKRSGCEVGAVVAAESAAEEVEARAGGARVMVVADALFQSISGTESAQGVMALVRPRAWKLDDLFTGTPLVVALDGVQDPGNAGAILRAAEAFGATGAMFLKGTVSPHNPKAVRASAGSVFRVPLATGLDPAAALRAFAEHGLDVYAAEPRGALDLGAADLARPCALIIGSEGAGVSREVRAGAAGLRIPVAAVESLNAAMSAGILLYEARRRRAIR
ncbi:MAG: TrmH family RNA methyltransferase [Acidobacteriota bacterium]